MENSIDTRGKGVSSFSVEFLQIPVVAGKHCRCGSFAKLSDLYRLLRQRLLECEQLSELACRRLPYRRCFTKVAMLFEQCNAQPGLTLDRSRRRVLFTSDQPEQSCLARSVAADDSPAVSFRRCECHVPEECRRAELDHCA